MKDFYAIREVVEGIALYHRALYLDKPEAEEVRDALRARTGHRVSVITIRSTGVSSALDCISNAAARSQNQLRKLDRH